MNDKNDHATDGHTLKPVIKHICTLTMDLFF